MMWVVGMSVFDEEITWGNVLAVVITLQSSHHVEQCFKIYPTYLAEYYVQHAEP